jgi:glycerol-3-phosphate dehydrogenase subunit B
VALSAAPLVVVGAGVAGTAAAWAAARAGQRVTVIHDRAGSSALSSGVIDHVDDDATHEHAMLRTFFESLGYRFGPTQVATGSGVVRSAYGAEDALLELEPVAGKRVAVADIGRDDWDAPLLARTLAASDWAERTRTSFASVAVKALRSGHERRIPPFDFCGLHDDEQRGAALVAALKFASESVDAWLVGPWLGLERETVSVLRRLLPLPLGETTSPVGGPAGARFESARTRVFAAAAVEVVRARVTRVAPRAGRWLVHFVDDAGVTGELEASALVLATGGVAAGGLLFRAEPARRERGFSLPFSAPVLVGVDGEAQGGGGSLYGPSLETVGLGLLERAGILADSNGRPDGLTVEVRGLTVAGDAVAGRPRTMLAAALSGLTAGTVAARD